MSTQYTIDEIKEGCAPLWGNVECMTCSRLLSYIDYLLSQLKDGGTTKCVCGHPKSDHELFSDHDECLGCRGLDEPCSEFRATAPTETSTRCGGRCYCRCHFQVTIRQQTCAHCAASCILCKHTDLRDENGCCQVPTAINGITAACGCHCAMSDEYSVFPASTEADSASTEQTGERRDIGDYACSSCGWKSTDESRPLSRGLKIGCPLCGKEARFTGTHPAPVPPVAQPEADPYEGRRVSDSALRLVEEIRTRLADSGFTNDLVFQLAENLLEQERKQKEQRQSAGHTVECDVWIRADAICTCGDGTTTPTTTAVEDVVREIMDHFLSVEIDELPDSRTVRAILSRYLPAQQPEVEAMGHITSFLDLTFIARNGRVMSTPEIIARIKEVSAELDQLRESADEIERLKGEVERLTAKYREYEQNYILPCFRWADEIGFDLREAVKDNTGKNCVELLVAELRRRDTTARRDAIGECVQLSIPTCGDCPFVDHSGAFTEGGAKSICGHRNALGTFTEHVVGEDRYHWKHRVVDSGTAPPPQCPIRVAALEQLKGEGSESS